MRPLWTDRTVFLLHESHGAIRLRGNWWRHSGNIRGRGVGDFESRARSRARAASGVPHDRTVGRDIFRNVWQGRKLLASPADETPSPPCDAQPEELDIALCVDRLEHALDLCVARIERSWAGLRTFCPDRTPAVGFDRHVPGFFWLAGQGGYGIQTSPALARLAAALARGQRVPPDLQDFGVDVNALDPARLHPF
jgi:glycine/D-amino acid oxidase-like deaminating enzyme